MLDAGARAPSSSSLTAHGHVIESQPSKNMLYRELREWASGQASLAESYREHVAGGSSIPQYCSTIAHGGPQAMISQ